MCFPHSLDRWFRAGYEQVSAKETTWRTKELLQDVSGWVFFKKRCSGGPKPMNKAAKMPHTGLDEKTFS